MNDQEIREQAEKIIQEKSVNYMQNLKQPINITHAKAFYDGAKWMQESEQWIELPAKELLTHGYYAIRITHNGFIDIKFEYIDNQIIPYHYATHYFKIELPNPQIK